MECLDNQRVWASYVSSCQQRGVSDEELSYAFTDALHNSNYDLIHSLIVNLRSARRVFKQMCWHGNVGADMITEMLRKGEFDLAFTVAVTKGLWPMALDLYDNEHVLLSSRRQALKTAIKQGAWDVVQTLVASHMTSDAHRRHAFLAATRHNRFDVALQLCHKVHNLHSEDLAFTIRMCFVTGNHCHAIEFLCHCQKNEAQPQWQSVTRRFLGKALKTAIKNEMWDALQTLVASQNTSVLQRRHAFLSAVRHNRFDVAFQLCQLMYLSTGDLKFAIRMCFAFGSYSSVLELLQLCQGGQGDCLSQWKNLLTKYLRKAIGNAVKSEEWDTMNTILSHHACPNLRKHAVLAAVRHNDFDVALHFCQQGMTLSARTLKSAISTCFAAGDFISLEGFLHLLESNGQHVLLRSIVKNILKQAISSGTQIVAGTGNKAQDYNVANDRDLQSIVASFKPPYDFPFVQIGESILMQSFEESTDTDSLFLPLVRYVIQQAAHSENANCIHLEIAANPQLMKYAIKQAFTHGNLQLVWKIVENCPELGTHIDNDFSFFGYLNRFFTGDFNSNVNMDTRMGVLRFAMRMAVKSNHSEFIQEAVNHDELTKWLKYFLFESSILRSFRTWPCLVPVIDKLIRQCSGSEHKIEELIWTMRHCPSRTLKRISKWCTDNSFPFIGLCLALASDDSRMVLRNLQNMETPLPETWDYRIFDSALDKGAWKDRKIWEMLIPLSERVFTGEEADDIDPHVTGIRIMGAVGEDKVQALEQWCFQNSFLNSALCVAMISDTKNWQRIEEAVNRLESHQLDLLSNIFRAAVKDSMFAVAVACLQKAPSDMEYFLEYFMFWEAHVHKLTPFIDYCRSDATQDLTVKVAVITGRWDTVEAEMANCGDQSLREYVLKKVSENGEWETVSKVLITCTGLESCLPDVLMSAIRDGHCECVVKLFEMVDPASCRPRFQPLVSMAIQEYSNASTHVLALCIQAGVSIQSSTTNVLYYDQYYSPIKKALRLDATKRLLVIRALFESGACTQQELRSLKDQQSQRQCPSDVLRFVEEVCSTPQCLQSQCRLFISKLIGCRLGRQARIASLPLPQLLKDYVSFHDVVHQLKENH